jgi:hydroxyethylthiazole kinase-like uncharacterized protein yjeF
MPPITAPDNAPTLSLNPLDGSALLASLTPRANDSHKGDYGGVGVLGGAQGMCGAVLLTSTAALLCGAGRVWASFLDESIPPPLLTARHPELMTSTPQALLANPALNVLCVGPGMGTSPQSRDYLAQSLGFDGTLILDADALNLLAQNSDLKAALKTRQRPTILTPHPGEAARLLNLKQITNRPETALKLAQELNAVVVLKGYGSLVATATGECWINPTGNPALAAPGMGDTLCGVVAGLAAQGLPALNALQLGVYIHGAAADALVARGLGPRGLTASELALEIRRLLNQGCPKA